MNTTRKLDIVILISVFGLVIMGLLALYSSSKMAMVEGVGSNYFSRQIVWVVVSFIAMILVYFLPHRLVFDSAYVLYALSLILLVLVIFFGRTGLGAERWLRIGPLVLQPSEFAKLATVLAVARFLSREEVDPNKAKHFLLAALFFFAPFVLIVRQPDLGTSLVFIAIALPMFYWAGLKEGNLILIITPLIVVFASFQFYTFLFVMVLLMVYLILSKRNIHLIIFNFIFNILMGLITPVLWNHLQPYQKNRIKIFLNPEADPKGAGYQIIQSKVAIGSGGFTGRGFLQGSQTQLRFLPEQHTDFIYAVIGEEFGFLGVLVGLILFLTLFLRGIYIATLMRNRFNSIVTIGIITILAFHTIINIGMTIGLLPVTGLPLPFLSYGGSALTTDFIMIGILLNFYKNRFEY